MYPLINYPTHLVLDMSELSLANLEKYFTWFIGIKAERLEIISNAIWGNPIQIYDLPKLLTDVAHFIGKSFCIRMISQEELDSIINVKYLPEDMVERELARIRKYRFIEPTLSILFDISILLGELMKKEFPDLIWGLERKKDYANYGWPTIKRNENTFYFFPSSIVNRFSQDLYEKKVAEVHLLELFNTWKMNLSEGMPGLDGKRHLR